jgi:hypothetical protein
VKEKGRKSETNDGKKPSACKISCVHRVPLRRKDNKQILKVCKKKDFFNLKICPNQICALYVCGQLPKG